MCEGFGCIVSRNSNIAFTHPDWRGNVHHSLILDGLRMLDNSNPFLRSFVRVEFTMWLEDQFYFDEESSLPGWAEENRQFIRDKCITLLRRVKPIYDIFNAECNEIFAKYRDQLKRRKAVMNYTDIITGGQTTYSSPILLCGKEIELDTGRRKMIKQMSLIPGYVEAFEFNWEGYRHVP